MCIRDSGYTTTQASDASSVTAVGSTVETETISPTGVATVVSTDTLGYRVVLTPTAVAIVTTVAGTVSISALSLINLVGTPATTAVTGVAFSDSLIVTPTTVVTAMGVVTVRNTPYDGQKVRCMTGAVTPKVFQTSAGLTLVSQAGKVWVIATEGPSRRQVHISNERRTIRIDPENRTIRINSEKRTV